jgi:hypothetical protein
MLLRLGEADADEICRVANDAAAAYRGVIPADPWKEPYMPLEEVLEEIEAGVVFWGYGRGGRLAGVMGLQNVQDDALMQRRSMSGAGSGWCSMRRKCGCSSAIGPCRSVRSRNP